MTAPLALLQLCFFLSGFAALLYQTVWIRELGFLFGTSELAVAIVLSAYMGGLALGAAVAARIAPRLDRPVLAYGLLELAIAGCALAVPYALRAVTLLYARLLGGRYDLSALAEPGTAALQLLGAFAVLVPPTALMGASLPLLARHAVRRETEIGSRVGALYAVNTAGAIAGALMAGFLLMPEIGLRNTVYVGALVNALVFLGAATLSRRAPAAAIVHRPAVGFGWILPAIAVSGAVSFAYEVLWSRLLVHVLGSSVYAFATMLASFLLGITLGSALAARVASTRARAERGFALSQLGVGLAAYATFAAANQLPALARGLGSGPGNPLAGSVLAVTVLLPLSLCVGATFPFAVRSLAQRPEQAPVASARVYAWNTVGSLFGSLGTGFWLLPRLGFTGTVAVAAAANLGLAAVAAVRSRPARPRLAVLAAGAAALGLVAPPWPPETLLRMSPLLDAPLQGDIAYTGIGRSTTVLLLDQGWRFRLVSGGLPESTIDKPEAHPIVYAGAWLGLLPGLVKPATREALVIGLGGGLALEAMPATIRRIDVVELEAEILAANRAVADERARDPLADPRVRVFVGDARGALLLTDRRYDAVVSQPSHPWTAGSSNLYTREFFSLVRSRLREGGVFVQWIGLELVDEELLRTLVATLVDVFPDVEVYRPNPFALFFAASDASVDGLAGARTALAARPHDFSRYGVDRVEDFAASLLLDAAGARAFSAGAPLNTDDHNLLSSRAPRLGSSALDPVRLRALMAPHDPLAARNHGLDRPALLRRLAADGQVERAERLLTTAEPAERARGLGWIRLTQRKPRAAAREFEKAIELGHSDADVLAGLALSRRSELRRGEPLQPDEAAALSPALAALLRGWRLESGGDEHTVSELDGALEAIRPGDPLFAEAVRMRIRWRLASAEPALAAPALEFATALAVRRAVPENALLRAQTAAAAGRPEVAWASLEHLELTLASAGRRTQELARRALALADALPAARHDEELRGRLAKRAR